MNETKSEALAAADTGYAAIQLFHQFLSETVRPVAKRFSDGHPEYSTYYGSLLRVQGWTDSLTRLDRPGDFQAAMSASRAVFEIATDLTLLYVDSSATWTSLLDWEESAKLKAAEAIRRYYRENNRRVPSTQQAMVDFANSNTSRIRAKRLSVYGNEKHPQRWTNRSLEADARRVEKLTTERFHEFYSVRHGLLCWNVHGSGLAGVRGIPPEHFPMLTAYGYTDTAEFGLVAARRCLQLLDVYDDIMLQRFAAVIEAMDMARIEVWARHHATSSGRTAYQGAAADGAFIAGDGARFGPCT